MNTIKKAPVSFIPSMVVLKVASHCNLYCTYCHWFRDPEVENKPKLLQKQVEKIMFSRLEDYIVKYGLSDFTICLHGGEPTLFGLDRIEALCNQAEELSKRTGAIIDVSMTTNAALVDEAMAKNLKRLKITVTVSHDGPKIFHDRYRVNRSGKGSFKKVRKGIDTLRAAGINPTGLCVLNPESNGTEIITFFIEEMKFKIIDFLIPDLDHEDKEKGNWKSIADVLISIFDKWFDVYSYQGVRIRLFESMIASIFGKKTTLQGVGFSPMCVLTINTDGSMENHDALRISGENSVKTNLNVMNDPIDSIFTNTIWRKPYDASLKPPLDCERCQLKYICRGGDVIHRHFKGEYQRKSVYCDDYKKIYPYIVERISDTWI